jgi:hypothetical protein
MKSGPPGVSAASITIAPGQHRALQVTASDLGSLQAAPLVLTTNDPDHPLVSIALDANQDGAGSGGSGSGDDHTAGGGCNAAGHGDLPFVALMVVGLLVVRTRE